MRCSSSLESGAYVLGALTPGEREAYERHLADCASCREEVAELAVLPGLLSRLDDAVAQEIGAGGGVAAPPKAPETLLPTILWEAQQRHTARRRRDRWRTIGAGLVAACLAVVAGVALDVLRSDRPAQVVSMTAMHAVSSEPVPVRAEIALISTRQGTKIRIHCWYEVESDHHPWPFRLVVVPRSGAEEQVGTWTAEYGDDFWVDQITRHMPMDIDRIELRRGDGVPLLAYEPS
jgi:anti-sigma-K factor RskA